MHNHDGAPLQGGARVHKSMLRARIHALLLEVVAGTVDDELVRVLGIRHFDLIPT